MNRMLRLAGLLLLLPLFLPAQPTGPTQRITYSADVQNGIVSSSGDEVIELSGNVRLQQGNVTITANQATYYSAGDRATLRGNVRIVQPGTILTAPAVDYNGGSGFAVAPSGVTIQDEDATLTAGHGEYYVNRRVSNFRNGVTLRDSNAVLTAERGTYNSLNRIATFEGNVVGISDSGRINADRLTYWRETEESFAVGNVRLFSMRDSSLLTSDTLRHRPDVETLALGNVVLESEKESATLTGDTLRHFPDRDYTVVTGSPRLVQIDSTIRPVIPSNDTATTPSDSLAGAEPPPPPLDTVRRGDSLFTVRRDTTEITALKLERFAGERTEFVATENARMKRGELEARGGIARFLEDEEVVALGPGTGRKSESDSTATGEPTDSVTAEKGNVSDPTDSVKGGEVTDEQVQPDGVAGEAPPDTIAPFINPIVWYEDSQLTGDTITVFLEEKKVRLIDVFGSAFAVSKSEAPNRYDQLASQHLIFNIYQDTIRTVHAQESAASIYFLYDNERPDGVNRSSSDTIIIWFDKGKASRIGYYGPRTGTEGEIIPESEVGGKETVYRLSGFKLYEREEKKEEKKKIPEGETPDGTEETVLGRSAEGSATEPEISASDIAPTENEPVGNEAENEEVLSPE